METGRETVGKKYQILSGNMLKMIAIVTMLIDHVGAALIEGGVLGVMVFMDYDAISVSPELMGWFRTDQALRLIGRLAFPIFCFLLVEGFLHTRDVKKYLVRMAVFGLLSEIPFDLAMFNQVFFPGYQNVYFTLFMGLLTLAAIQKCEEYGWSWQQVMVIAAGYVAADGLMADYGGFGVIFIALLYYTRRNVWVQTISGAVMISWETTAPLAFIPIRMYNGKRGKWNLKYLFYGFYPLHLLVLWIIREFVFK